MSVTVLGPWLGECTGMSPVSVSVGIAGRKSYHGGMKAKVSEKGQVTIPKRLRDSLGIEPGDVLDFDEESGRLVAVKQVPPDAFERLRGILRVEGTDEVRTFETTEEYMAWVRPHRFGPPEDRIPWLEESLREVEGDP
jgi:AbrB family looped-hinge helix DNA binding protein